MLVPPAAAGVAGAIRGGGRAAGAIADGAKDVAQSTTAAVQDGLNQAGKTAQDIAKGADELRRKAADDLLSKRLDEKALKKKTQELRQISDKIAFPITADGFKLQGELRTKLETLLGAEIISTIRVTDY